MPDNNEAKWYIIHTFGGYEKKVKTSIENYARAQGMENIIQQVYLPTDIVVETKNGKRKEVEKLRFPNYLFLKLVYGNNEMVPGIEEAVGNMRVGGKATIIVPSVMGFGDIAIDKDLPAYSTVIFDLELIDVQKVR